MRFSRIKVFAFSLPLVLLMGASAVASADSIIINGTFNTPASSPVSWGTLGANGGNVNGPGTVTWGTSQYGYDPTNIPGWTFSPLTNGVGGSGIADQGSAFGFTSLSSGASQIAFLQQTDTLSQQVNLIVGDKYSLLFSLEGRPATGGAVTTVTIGGTTLLSDVVPATGTWTSYEEPFIASSSTETLMFSTTPDNSRDTTTGIDDVQIVTPEPGSLMLLGTGLLALAGMGRRRFGKKNT